MVIIKKNYYLYIENIEDLNLDKVASNKKIIIILRNNENNKLPEIKKYRLKCKRKKIKFYIANNAKIAKSCEADGLYISAYNKKKYYINIPKIGSAHNLKEINEKIYQKCEVIIFSRLFKTQYLFKKDYLGVVKFNLIVKNIGKKLIPLGGINNQNLLKLNIVKSDGFACLSAVKKKPAISSRLF
jgi:thiamine monophosphate synthase